MTHREKRDSGQLFDYTADPEMNREHYACKDKCWKYNQLKPSDIVGRTALLRELLGKTGDILTIHSPFWCDYGYNIEVGENFFANHGCVFLDGGKITFGNNVFIAPLCGFYTAGHPVDFHRRNLHLEYSHPIKVGDNVWIGGGTHVMPGVTIGNNVVIGAGSVVTKNIPDNVVAVGNPCRVIRPITEEDKRNQHIYNP